MTPLHPLKQFPGYHEVPILRLNFTVVIYFPTSIRLLYLNMFEYSGYCSSL